MNNSTYFYSSLSILSKLFYKHTLLLYIHLKSLYVLEPVHMFLKLYPSWFILPGKRKKRRFTLSLNRKGSEFIPFLEEPTSSFLGGRNYAWNASEPMSPPFH